jgi:ADP-heptose:LPS heptosyltransferase
MYRELPLKEWQPIFDSIGAHFVSLQYKDAEKDIAGTPVVQYPYATLTPDYDDTAALVASCDLVIGMQTSVCHTAGALGVPVWTMIPKQSQWRYGEEYTDVPWYKSMKLYRQKESWAPVVRKIAEDLKAWAR